MLFRFIGTSNGPDEIDLYGFHWVKGEPTEVDPELKINDKSNAKVVDKLTNHPAFEVVSKVKKAKPKADPVDKSGEKKKTEEPAEDAGE